MRVLLVMLCGWLMLGHSVAWAYEEIQVTDGGMIAGKVTITEGTPIPKGFGCPVGECHEGEAFHVRAADD